MEKEQDNIPIKEEPIEKKSHKKIVILVSVAAAVILSLSYLLPVFYFENHYLFQTIINDQDMSRYNTVTAEQMMSDEMRTYSLTIIGRNDLEDVIKSPEIDMDYMCTGDFERIMKEQNEYLWFVSLFRPSHYVLEKAVVYNPDKLSKRVQELNFFTTENRVRPEDAHIGPYDPELNQYVIISEELGSEIYPETILADVEQSVVELHELLDLTSLDDYVEPEIFGDNETLNQTLDTMNRYLNTVVTYEFGEDTEILDGRMIHEWIEYDGDPDSEPILNDDMIYDYVKSLANTYDTYGRNRSFTTTNGVSMTLPSGPYGWKISKDEEAEALKELIIEGAQETREPIYSAEAACRGVDDIGNSYVEIDLSSQHLYLYLEGEIVLESDFVSGDVLTGNATPEGVFGIRGKTTDAILRGETWETPVKYWMPFNGGIGMHDATWRRHFGGTIYETNGSHGCINLPFRAAETIYGYMHKGFPVICYYNKAPEENSGDETADDPDYPDSEPNYVITGEVNPDLDHTDAADSVNENTET